MNELLDWIMRRTINVFCLCQLFRCYLPFHHIMLTEAPSQPTRVSKTGFLLLNRFLRFRKRFFGFWKGQNRFSGSVLVNCICCKWARGRSGRMGGHCSLVYMH